MKLNVPRKMRLLDLVLFALLTVLACHLLLVPRPLFKVACWRDTEYTQLTPLGVLCITKPSDHVLEFTQYGFNKWKRWSVRVKKDRTGYDISPDGHFLTVMTIEENQPAVRTYRDGKLLSVVPLPRTPHNTKDYYVDLMVLNSGQVWTVPHIQIRREMDKDRGVFINEKADTLTRFPVYLIEGKRLLTGSYQPKTPLPPGVRYIYNLAPDDATLRVSIKTPAATSSWVRETVALRKEKNRVICAYRNTTTVYEKAEVDRLMHPPMPGWTLPKTTDKYGMPPSRSTDGRFATMITGTESFAVTKLSVYERPGKLRATRTFRNNSMSPSCQRSGPMAISANGHYVLFLNTNSTTRDGHLGCEYILYRW